MAALPRLNINGLPSATPEESTATQSPARGKEMRANLLSKLRPPPLVHSWDFWHDRQDRSAKSTSTTSSGTVPQQQTPKPEEEEVKQQTYENRLVHLAQITDLRTFWSCFNNFDIGVLPLRDSIHLFHHGVKPIWEDQRNARGGSWTFRVPKEKAAQFWTEVALLAIGERLQSAVASDRQTFIDDICGISLSVRFTSILVQVWNRDAEHVAGVEGILKTVLEGVSEGVRPKGGAFYYKRHREHAGFGGGAAGAC